VHPCEITASIFKVRLSVSGAWQRTIMSWYQTLFLVQVVTTLVVFFVAIATVLGYLLACGGEDDSIQVSGSTESVELSPMATA
jgi:hypothetical protein